MTFQFLLQQFYEALHWSKAEVKKVTPKDGHTLELATIYGKFIFTFEDQDHWKFEKGATYEKRKKPQANR